MPCLLAIFEGLAFIKLVMPTLVETLPHQGDWSTEAKFNDWRCQIIIDRGARVFARRGHDWTDRPKIVAAAASEELRVNSAIIDDELVYPQTSGISDFHTLQAVVRSQSTDRWHGPSSSRDARCRHSSLPDCRAAGGAKAEVRPGEVSLRHIGRSRRGSGLPMHGA
jgi:hypothetical protein